MVLESILTPQIRTPHILDLGCGPFCKIIKIIKSDLGHVASTITGVDDDRDGIIAEYFCCDKNTISANPGRHISSKLFDATVNETNLSKVIYHPISIEKFLDNDGPTYDLIFLQNVIHFEKNAVLRAKMMSKIIAKLNYDGLLYTSAASTNYHYSEGDKAITYSLNDFTSEIGKNTALVEILAPEFTDDNAISIHGVWKKHKVPR